MPGGDAASTRCCAICRCLFDSKHSLTAHLVTEHMQWIRFRCSMCVFAKSDELDSLLGASTLISKQQSDDNRSACESIASLPFESNGNDMMADLISDNDEKTNIFIDNVSFYEGREDQNSFGSCSPQITCNSRAKTSFSSTRSVKTTPRTPRNNPRSVVTEKPSPTTRPTFKRAADVGSTNVSFDKLSSPTDFDGNAVVAQLSTTYDGAQDTPGLGSLAATDQNQTLSDAQSTLESSTDDDTARPLACAWPNCETLFLDRRELLTHTKAMHKGKYPPQKRLESQQGWSNQRKTEHPPRQPTRTVKKRFQKTSERTFECTWSNCMKRYADNRSLQRHLRSHTGERPFKCTYQDCLKRYADNNDLRRHIRGHVGYSCRQCLKVFGTKNILYRHEDTCVAPPV